MTRPLRMAGVVVVASLAVAIPALASGQDRAAVPAAAARALLCPGPRASGGRQLVFLAPATHSKSRHRGPRAGHAPRSRSKGAPAIGCVPPCGRIVIEPAAATGPATLRPRLTCDPRLVCVLAGANRARVFCHPIPCIRRYAHGSGTATGAAPTAGARFLCGPFPCSMPSLRASSGATGEAGLCPPLPCPRRYIKPPGSAGPATGVALLCRPLPCPIANADTPGGATGPTGALPCPLPPICPLAGTVGAPACPAPCVYAGVNPLTGPTGTTATCPPIPICPPEPRTTASSALPALYACPQIAAGSAAGD